MVRGQFPLIIAVLLIASLTLVEGIYMKDRWGAADVTATEFGKRFKDVPKEIGAWSGQDLPVDDIVKQTAGAVSYVSRQYVHNTTGKSVKLWLIVGHSRDIVRHTPNICYPASGFRQDGAIIRQNLVLDSGDSAEFYTAKFDKEDAYSHHTVRVFWAWNHPETKIWEAPPDKPLIDGPRYHYGLSRALYKVYFTSNVLADEKTVDDNVAADFAKLMLPAIDQALFPEDSKAEPADETTNEEEVASNSSAETAG